jgi:energy-coupling factor transporter ATP-binding protein EcfA2
MPDTTFARIKKITVSGYRAFPPFKPKSLEIDLGDSGLNLLLYGENGSGKTSLYRALKDLCDTSERERIYAKEQNIFVRDQDDAIAVELTAGTPSDYRWQVGEPHPKTTEGTPFQTFSKTCLFLDYRDLLQTNFVHRSGSPNLFVLLVEAVLQDLPVPARKLSEIYGEMLESIPSGRRTKNPVRRANNAAAALREALVNHLPEVVQRTNVILSKLQKGTEIVLTPPASITYSSRAHDFSGKSIELTAILNGQNIVEPQHFLNEARLTAIALAIYLAAAQITRNGRPGIMVLDDVLIGLDLSHRLPLLKLLKEEFGDWQLLLLTHDRTWYDLAQIETALEGKWTTFELQTKPSQLARTDGSLLVFDSPYPLPPKGSNLFEHFLQKARESLLPPRDERMAGLYTRVAFESKIKHFCSKHHLAVTYNLDPKQLDTDDFLDAIKTYAMTCGKLVKNHAAIFRVEQFRKGVLNPLAHCHPIALHPCEIELAIEAVAQLKFDTAINCPALIEAALAAPPSDSTRNEVAVNLRTLFELDVRDLLIRLRGTLTYRHDWLKIETLELWNSAKEIMSRTNLTEAGLIIAGIESHSAVYLDEWQFSRIRSLTHAQLQQAWNAFVSPTFRNRTKLSQFR